jgi:hypothetical protein
VGDAVGGVAVPMPDGSSAADAGPPVDADRLAHCHLIGDADWTTGGDGTPDVDRTADGGWASDGDMAADPAQTGGGGWTADADPMAVEADWAAGDGWAADWWGDVWPLGGRVASAVLPVLSAEPDRPVESRDLASLPPGPALAHELALQRPSEVSAADLVDVIVGCERLARWADAVQAAAVAELPPPAPRSRRRPPGTRGRPLPRPARAPAPVPPPPPSPPGTTRAS